ncbi:MAG: hypothetical protein AYK22_07865 [Thermoplasmatales archaeon SG8-52-3]|nr:MAG: hypothetical protein AYK22_07865 [Thermoplasmatales archaeon SG8-52-3]
MKKIFVPCICLMLVITIAPFVSADENEFEKNDFKYDVIPLFFFQRWNPLWQMYFKHLDIVSFSITEDSEDSEFLHVTMELRDFKYSEYRSVYAVYWTYEYTRYFVVTNTHSEGQEIIIKAGYFDVSGEEQSTLINGEINEEENTLSWIVPKDLIGNPNTGDEFTEVHANTFLILQKDCQVKFPIYLAKDIARPLLKPGYTYTVVY